MRQVGWTARNRNGLRYSGTPYYRRFVIMENHDQQGRFYTVVDTHLNDQTRVRTFAAAKAWAGIRVGEKDIRHG